MLRFIQTCLLLTLASLSLVLEAQAETDSTTTNLPRPIFAPVNSPQSAERSTLQPTESQGSPSAADVVKQADQLKLEQISEHDRIILQYQLQLIIPAEPQR
jgi:hypothetical protein